MINSTLCYIEKDNSYLMLHRIKKEHDANKDKWIGVGGKLEENETPDECVVRETLEETGLTLTNYRLRAIITFISDEYEGENMYLYTADEFEGDIKDCDEGTLEWVPFERVLSLPTWEGDRLFLEQIMKNADFFTMKLRYEGDKLKEWNMRNNSIRLSADEYQKLAMRTLNPQMSERDVLINSVMGLCGESGEVIDLVKKHLAQGHDLDKEKMARELGDVAWYLAEAATALGISLEEVLKGNIDKLKKRYPEGFDSEKSINRRVE